MVKKVLKSIAKVIKKIGRFVKKYWKSIAIIAVAFFAPQITAFIGLPTAGLTGAVSMGAVVGGLSGLIMTGSLKGAIKGAIFGALSGAAAHGIGTLLPSGTASTANVGEALSWKSSALFKTGTAWSSASGQLVFTRTLSTIGKIAKSFFHAGTQGVIGKLRGGSFSKTFISSFVSNGGQEFGLATTPLAAGLVGGAASRL